MNGVDNMIYMDSVSANNGVVQLLVDFDVKANPDIDQVLAQLRVDQAQAQLPSQVTTAGLTVQKALTFRGIEGFSRATELQVLLEQRWAPPGIHLPCTAPEPEELVRKS